MDNAIPQKDTKAFDQSIRIFIQWIRRKIRLHHTFTKKAFSYKERDIWWASLGHNVGSEQNGKHERFERPVLILKAVNRDLFISLPVTSKPKQGAWYYQYRAQGKLYSLLLSQIRVLSTKRLLRRIHRLTEDEFKQVRNKISSLFYINDSPGETGGISEPLAR